MRLEVRYETDAKGRQIPRGLVAICESPEESEKVDQVMGKEVGKDGLISISLVECRLSDGYDKHYLYVQAPRKKRKL